MNILIIEDRASTDAGGAELSMRHYSEYLHSKGHQLYLAYASGGDMVTDNTLSYIYNSCTKISVLPLLVKNPFAYFRSLISLYRLCRKNKIELIVTHVIHGFPLLRKLKFLHRAKIGVFFKWIPNMPDVGKQAKWGIKCIDYAIGNTHYVTEYWQKQGVQFNAKRTVIADGIFKPVVTGNPFTIKDPLVPPEGKLFRLLFIGRVSEGKGLHLLIDAIKELSDYNIILLVAGKFDPENDEYHKLVWQKIADYQIADKICFLGFIENNNVGDLLTEVDLLVVPSIWTEARPRTIMEAMALGKLVIGSRNGGVPETLGAELDSFLFEPNSSKSLREKIQFIYDNKKELEEKYKEILIRKFETEYSFSNTQQLLTESLEIC